LHGGAGVQGLILSIIGVGSLAGALVVASMKRSYGYGLPVVVGAICFAFAVMAFSFSHWLVVSCAIGVAIGVFSVTYQTQNQTLLQVLSPPQLRGRVMSIYLLNRGTVPIGALLAGSLASAFGVASAMRIMAGLSLMIIFAVVASRPQILRLKVPFRDAQRGAASDEGGTSARDGGGAKSRPGPQAA
jgi:MFS family permease